MSLFSSNIERVKKKSEGKQAIVECCIAVQGISSPLFSYTQEIGTQIRPRAQ